LLLSWLRSNAGLQDHARGQGTLPGLARNAVSSKLKDGGNGPPEPVASATVNERPSTGVKRYELVFSAFMALFVTFVVLTNTVGVKLFTIRGVTLPVSIIWYPLTFLVTDIVSEVYGAARARFLVISGFAMSLVLLAFSLIGIALPTAPVYALQKDYVNIFGPVWRLLLGSLTAYLLAQLIDVQLFHFWKRLTRGRHLWLRNNGSTMISQLVDSATVNVIFLYKNPTVFNGTFQDLLGIVFWVYLVKVAIAAADTPLCYLAVWATRRYTGRPAGSAT
jgi:uncharacterized integral membrane protein (TIGR00697 family)